MAFVPAALAFHLGIVLVIGYFFPSLPLLLLLLDWDAHRPAPRPWRRYEPHGSGGPGAVLALLVASCAAALVAGGGPRAHLRAPARARRPGRTSRNGIRVPRAGVRGRHAVPGKFDVRVAINGQRFRGPARVRAVAGPGR